MYSLKDKFYNSDLPLVVALDGPAASGKGHIGRILADEFKLLYFQSSLVYRGLAYLCISDKIDLYNTQEIIEYSRNTSLLELAAGVDLQQEHIGDFASKIATIKEVRENLTSLLQRIIRSNTRIIMEGRDIGTKVSVNADLKIFITASVEKRANRRFIQLQASGKKCIFEDILNSMKERDVRDITRNAAPLVPAEGALVIDTDNLTPDAVIQRIKNYFS